ncbi:hypothetical protein HKCCE3408_13185 [Rhodobacterales bacterium HKCCE3408]|nr:hypothetical protein [Rhodobacterales bacterium HKCCE3408]
MKRILFLLIVVFGLGVALWAAAVRVGPAEQAVVVRDGTVDRVLEPGMHWHIPLVEAVSIYPAQLETQHALLQGVDVAGCRLDVSVVTGVSDVAAYHEGGAVSEMPASLSEAARAAIAGLEAVPASAGDPREIVATVLQAQLEDRMPPGLQLRRVLAEGDCAPPPEPEPAPAADLVISVPETEGDPGAERTDLPEFRVMTGDRVQVRIAGVAATWDMVDETRFDACFGGDREIAGQRLAPVVESALRAQAETVEAGEFATITEGLAGEIAARSPDLESTCGVVLRAVDFSDAEVEAIRP